jgi:Diacylglycerol kinase catalytic domain
MSARCPPARRAALVVHPGKHDDMDGFRAVVCKAMTGQGWAEPLWLETSLEHPGGGLAAKAVRAGVDLVLASGGDGTITACVGAIAGTGIPLGVLPCGTGNLLARNLGLPLSLDEALAVALTGADRRLDVGTANGQPFVVMAGLGFDAELLAGASEQLRGACWCAFLPPPPSAGAGRQVASRRRRARRPCGAGAGRCASLRVAQCGSSARRTPPPAAVR